MNTITQQPTQTTTAVTELLAELRGLLSEKDALVCPELCTLTEQVIAAKDETIRQLNFKLSRIEAQLEKHLRARFGQSSETIDPATLLPYAQGILGEMVADGAAVGEQVKAEQAALGEAPADPKIQPKRQPLPAHLKRVRIVHALDEAQRTCPCCGEVACKIGEATSERLQYVPAQVTVEVHVEEKYACPKCRNNGCGTCGCEGRMMQAKKPPQAIEKSSVGAGLLAFIAASKYGDHLPLHRQEDILTRHGIDLGRSTTCNWMMLGCELFVPLINLMKLEILEGLGVQLDDTTVKMLEPGSGKTRTARCWIYQGNEKHRLTVFEFQKDRCAEHPKKWFADTGFIGHAQCDAYSGYDHLGDPLRIGGPMPLVGCFAHVRRKFNDAEKSGDKRANAILFLIQKLYAVEKEAKEQAGMDPKGPTHLGTPGVTESKVDALWSHRQRLRQEKSRPILEKQIKPWLEGMKAQVLPKSALGEAVGYALNQWPRLLEYLQHGHVEIDNNAAERALRCVAIGRKNWEFVGSERGGDALCVYASVISSAKQHGHEAYAYLRDLFEKLPLLREAGWPEEELRKFLPNRWTPPAK